MLSYCSRLAVGGRQLGWAASGARQGIRMLRAKCKIKHVISISSIITYYLYYHYYYYHYHYHDY